ncbi:hypothetical protein ACFQGE_03115 [Halomicroarcula sp. GCM10025817]|uniref:hypothetical protein n=1 Tax=Haloarcula TaxID=2237 RepID=UPI0023E814E7|nr:hypothetical protein [Halomicroarcula sp. SYNS111]
MSVAESVTNLRTDTPLEQLRDRTVAVLFGDGLGLAVFFASLCLFGLVWRTDFLITDSYTLANGLYSLSNGQLVLTDVAYGLRLDTPGAERVGDALIARNYGAIVLSLPVWLALEGLERAVDLRIALVALWSLALLALVVTVGRHLDDERLTVAGSVGVLALFGLNVALARPLDGEMTHLYALQLFHLGVAAFTPVLFYRLVSRLHSARVGLAGTVVLVLGTPLALWASVPKRHALTATAVVAVAYFLYRSRTDADGTLVGRPATFRGLAYATVGLYAWVHAPEALLLLVALAVADVPTAPDNSARTLAIVGVAFALSLVPFLVTNALVVGSPLKPPRLFAVSGGGGDAVSSAVGGPSGGSTGPLEPLLLALSPFLSVVSTFLRPLAILAGELLVGFESILAGPAEIYHTLVRSGHTSGTLNLDNEEAVNLAVLESAPVLLVAVGALRAAQVRATDLSLPPRVLPATRVVDRFALLTVVGLTLQYVSRLPIHAQITVRYLFPLFPLGVYLVVRLPVVRQTLTEHWRPFAWTVAGTLLVGGQLVVVVVSLTADGLGEAFQFHALLALGAGIPLGLWALAGRSDGWAGRAGAVLLGVATAVPTLFVLLVALEYYPLGNAHALPMVRALADVLTLL